MRSQDTFRRTAFVTGPTGLLGNNLRRFIAKSRRELGLQFRPVSVTLSDEIQWYRSHRFFLAHRQPTVPLLIG
jgi:hypothetical protein